MPPRGNTSKKPILAHGRPTTKGKYIHSRLYTPPRDTKPFIDQGRSCVCLHPQHRHTELRSGELVSSSPGPERLTCSGVIWIFVWVAGECFLPVCLLHLEESRKHHQSPSLRDEGKAWAMWPSIPCRLQRLWLLSHSLHDTCDKAKATGIRSLLTQAGLSLVGVEALTLTYFYLPCVPACASLLQCACGRQRAACGAGSFPPCGAPARPSGALVRGLRSLTILTLSVTF